MGGCVEWCVSVQRDSQCASKDRPLSKHSLPAHTPTHAAITLLTESFFRDLSRLRSSSLSSWISPVFVKRGVCVFRACISSGHTQALHLHRQLCVCVCVYMHQAGVRACRRGSRESTHTLNSSVACMCVTLSHHHLCACKQCSPLTLHVCTPFKGWLRGCGCSRL